MEGLRSSEYGAADAEERVRLQIAHDHSKLVAASLRPADADQQTPG
jgi:hypothetical protein